jgi:hypothetical protein
MASIVPATTPQQGSATQITIGGTAVIAAAGGFNGGYLVNPLSSTDQNISSAEVLYLDPVGACGLLKAGGTIIALQPGQVWNLIPGQTTPTFVNAATSGHQFTVVLW